MRSFTILFAVLIAIILIVSKVQADSDEDCYDEDLKITVKRGHVVDPEGDCLRLRCSESGQLRTEPCEFAVPPGCRVVDGDETKTFPACCPTVQCD